MKNAVQGFGRIRELSALLNSLPGVEREQTPNDMLSATVSDPDLRRIVEPLFRDGHHSRAVEEAFKVLNKVVKEKARLDDTRDGAALMREAFSPRDPVLQLNALGSSPEKDEQLGYMDLFAGCMTGIRNPRAHDPDWQDSSENALALIVFADHLIFRAKQAKRCQKQ